MPNTRLQVRITDNLAQWLAGRSTRMMTASPDLQARVELGMWQSALALELRRHRFTLAEACLIADVLNGTTVQPSMGNAVRFEVEDALRPAVGISSDGGKGEVDQAELMAKIGQLGPVADHALADAIARWWAAGADPTVDGFRAAGINVLDPADGRS